MKRLPKVPPSEQLADHCRELGRRNRLDPEAVELFIGNKRHARWRTLNLRTGQRQPIATPAELERLLIAFAHTYAQAT